MSVTNAPKKKRSRVRVHVTIWVGIIVAEEICSFIIHQAVGFCAYLVRENIVAFETHSFEVE